MSIVLITQHDENIFNSTKKATTYHKKSPRYVSKHRQRIKFEIARTKGKGFAEMGLPRQPLPNPANYLKKHSAKPFVKQVLPDSPKTKEKMPGIPTTAELLEEYRSRKGKPPKKNFIHLNAKHNIEMKPKDPMKQVAIDRYGFTKELTRGLEPQHIHSHVFGKTPKYLAKLIKLKQRNLQIKKDSFGTEQPKCRYITREERDKLLTGLKQNWEELQKQYQGLPILTDTTPKINRKSKMEAALKQLEKDIVLVERHPYIYVYDDDDLTC